MIKTFGEFVESAPAEGGLRSILSDVCDVYSHWRLLKYTGILYQGKQELEFSFLMTRVKNILSWHINFFTRV